MSHDFTDSVQEQAPEALRNDALKLPHGANVTFVYRHNPLRWQWAADLEEWLPSLGTRPISIGIGGVDSDGDTIAAEHNERVHGWHTIPHACVPDGATKHGTYIKRLPCANGIYHCSIWEYPQHVGGRVLESVIDTDGYREWLRWLMAEGHVAAPTRGALLLCTAPQRQRTEQIRQALTKHPHIADQLAAERAKTAAMEAVAEAM